MVIVKVKPFSLFFFCCHLTSFHTHTLIFIYYFILLFFFVQVEILIVEMKTLEAEILVAETSEMEAEIHLFDTGMTLTDSE